METILKKVGHIALLCLVITAIFLGVLKIADYVTFEYLMRPRSNSYILCVAALTTAITFFLISKLRKKVFTLVEEVVQEMKDLPASGGQTTRSSNTSRPKRVFVDGKFVNVDSVDDVTPKNGATSSRTQPPQGGSNSSWRDRAEKAQEAAGKWANAAWDTATPWAKTQGEAVARHAEQKPLIFWGGGLLVVALLVASKSITLFACLVLAAIACFVAHNNKAAIGEALSKLGPVSTALILIVVGGMLAYDEVEAGLMLILMGCAFLVGLASYHVYKQSGSYAKGVATAGVCLFLASFVFFKLGLPGYALLIGLSGIVLLVIAGVMYWFTKKYPPAKNTKEELEKELEKKKAEMERELIKVQTAMLQKKIDEIAAKAAAIKVMQEAGASEDAINEAVKRMFGGQQQRKKK